MQLSVLRDLIGDTAPLPGFEQCKGAFGMPEEYLPDDSCFREGLDIFRNRHAGFTGRSDPSRALLELGRKLWVEKLTESEDEDLLEETSDVEDDEEDIESFIWTPESAAGLLESMVRHGTLMIRRSRWFCRVSESTIGWESRRGEKHLMIIASGLPGRSVRVPSGDRLPTPPGHEKSFQERQQSFDLQTYDRMRVLTTELRRLVSEERKVELRFGPSSDFENPDLEKLLRWV
jgi:hypothetical protein